MIDYDLYTEVNHFLHQVGFDQCLISAREQPGLFLMVKNRYRNKFELLSFSLFYFFSLFFFYIDIESPPEMTTQIQSMDK